MIKRKERDATPMGALMLTVDQVAALCNLGVSTVWKLAKDERSGFPKPIYFGTRTTRWKAKDIHDWVDKLGTVPNVPEAA